MVDPVRFNPGLVATFASCIKRQLTSLKRVRHSGKDVGLMQPIACIGNRNRQITGQIKSCQRRSNVVIVNRLLRNLSMRHAVFFTFYFWFSHSSPTAVE
jgi:hypothetical protein